MAEGTRRPPATDVAIAAVILAFTLIGTNGAAQNSENALRAMDAGGYLLAALAAATFTVRRVAPLIGLAVCGVAVAVYFAVGYTFGPILLVLGLMTVSAAAGLPLGRVLPAGVGVLAVVVAGLAVRFGREPDDPAAVALLAGPAWLAVPFSIGTVIRLRNEGRLRTRREEADRTVHAERMRIAAEVHDVAGHGLAVIAMQAGVALHVLERKPEQARIALEEIRAASTEALDGLRASLAQMRTPDSAPLVPGLPGLADIPALVERIRRAGLAVDLDLAGDPDAIGPSVSHATYRIAQESLTNVLRHAHATLARVVVTTEGGLLRLRVDNDGPDVAGAGREGSGIAGMRDRVERLGGTLSAGPRAEGGFEVTAAIPYAERQGFDVRLTDGAKERR